MPEDDLPRMTMEEFFQFETGSEERHEFVDGYLFVLAGPTARHHLIVKSLDAIITKHLEPSRCTTFTNTFMVRIESLNCVYQPDLLVTCAPFDIDDYFTDSPIMIIEVLSPSTAATDRREKLTAYEKIESLREYLIVYQSIKRVDLYRKNGRRFAPREIFTSGSFELQSLPPGPLTVPIESVYEGLERGGPPEPMVREQPLAYTW
jgi:Uma2 family endonuclease